MAREITPEEIATVDEMIDRASVAMEQIKDYDQEQVDRLARALGWHCGNEKTFLRIAQMGVDESGIGDRAGRAGKRFKILGVLRDALRQRSVGVIEEDPAKGLIKIGKPAGVIASLIPTTNPELTPPVTPAAYR
jgi:sulfoacetaldehyde dehydrogenase